VERVRSEHRGRLGQARDAYLRERLHDFEDLADRLLRHLAGERPGVRPLPEDSILIARNLGPADLLEYDRTHLKGLLLEEGSAASHASIVARALQIPCVGRLAGLRDRISEGDAVIVDAEGDVAHLRPRPDVLAVFASRLEVRRQRRAEFARLRDTPAVTLDGVAISMLMNAGLAVDLETLDGTGADGIGLFRTEFQFMVAEELPRLQAQTDLYARVLGPCGRPSVTFRTLDLGGDKVAPYLPIEREDNPALGWRAVRMGLDRPALLRLQLRALIAAARGASCGDVPADRHRGGVPHGRRLVDRELQWAGAPGQARARQSAASAPWWRRPRSCSTSTRSCRRWTSSRSGPTT
jgi:phosphotransferase system enzyme I (PtsP)